MQSPNQAASPPPQGIRPLCVRHSKGLCNMARSRNIKPGFFKNEILASLDAHTRLFFAGLWTIADREGRFEVRLEKLKAEIFPHEQVMLESCMTNLWDKQFIILYEVFGKRFGQVNNWHKHQTPHHKEIASQIPCCEQEKIFNNQEELHAWLMHESSVNHSRFKKSASSPLIPDSLNLIPDSLIPDSGFPSKDLSAQNARPSKKGTALSAEWFLPKEWGEWALAEKPHWTADDVRRVADDFKDHWLANANQAKAKKSDWLATWRKWVRSPLSEIHSSAGVKYQTADERRMASTDKAIAEWLGESSGDVIDGEFHAG